jgi:hypothetical protein
LPRLDGTSVDGETSSIEAQGWPRIYDLP